MIQKCLGIKYLQSNKKIKKSLSKNEKKERESRILRNEHQINNIIDDTTDGRSIYNGNGIFELDCDKYNYYVAMVSAKCYCQNTKGFHFRVTVG